MITSCSVNFNIFSCLSCYIPGAISSCIDAKCAIASSVLSCNEDTRQLLDGQFIYKFRSFLPFLQEGIREIWREEALNRTTIVTSLFSSEITNECILIRNLQNILEFNRMECFWKRYRYDFNEQFNRFAWIYCYYLFTNYANIYAKTRSVDIYYNITHEGKPWLSQSSQSSMSCCSTLGGKYIKNRLNTMNYFIEMTCEIDDYHIQIGNNGMKLLMHQCELKSHAS